MKSRFEVENEQPRSVQIGEEESPAVKYRGSLGCFIGFVLGAACLAATAHQREQNHQRQHGGEVNAPISLTLLHLNDHHAHLENETLNLDVSHLKLKEASGSVQVSYGGFPMMVKLFHERTKANKNVLRIHGGDALTGTSYYSLFKGKADAEMMSLLCLDAFAIGNHEFDDGDTTLANFIHLLHGFDATCTDVPVLGANIVPGPTSKLKGNILNYTIKTVEGQRIGLIGVDVKGKTLSSSSPDEGTDFIDEVLAAQWNIDKLRNDGINKIILLTHIGYHADLNLAPQLSGVDVIVGGDSHTLLGGPNKHTEEESDDVHVHSLFSKSAGSYPTLVKNKDGEQVCIVQAWEYAHLLGELSVTFDENGVVSDCSGKPIVPANFNSLTRHEVIPGGGKRPKKRSVPIPAAEAEKVRTFMTHLGFQHTERDGVADAVLQKYSTEADKMKLITVGEAGEDLCVERFPGQGRSTICNDWPHGWQHGSTIGTIVARAFLDVAKTADMVFINGGSVRADLAQGEFTWYDVQSLLPFANTIVHIEMTGAEVKQVLEDALSNTIDLEGSSGSYPYAQGFRSTVDCSKPKGSRIVNPEVNSRLEGTWGPLDLERIYDVSTTNYLALGKDGFVEFKKHSNTNTGVVYTDALIRYVEAQGSPIVTPPTADFSTQKYIDMHGCDHSIVLPGKCPEPDPKEPTITSPAPTTFVL